MGTTTCCLSDSSSSMLSSCFRIRSSCFKTDWIVRFTLRAAHAISYPPYTFHLFDVAF